MERYIGLDGHTASCTVAVVSEGGKRLRDFPVETNGQALVEVIRSVPGRRHLVFEEGAHSAWLYEILRPHVDEIVVARLPRRRGQKSDARDAYELAEQLRMGGLEQRVFKAPQQFAMLRELASSHRTVTRELVHARLRLKSLYRSRGIQTPGASVYSLRQRDAWLRRLPPSSRKSAGWLYEQIDFWVEQKREAERDLLEESSKHRVTRILRTAPGLGPIRVAELVPIVVTPHRFRTKRQFWSYCGLGIVMRSSSDWARTPEGDWVRAPVLQTRGLTRSFNRPLKAIFKGAATTVITQRNKDPLYGLYRRLLEVGTKPNLAKLTLARKIAAIVLRMWKNEEIYRPEAR